MAKVDRDPAGNYRITLNNNEFGIYLESNLHRDGYWNGMSDEDLVHVFVVAAAAYSCLVGELENIGISIENNEQL